MSDPPVCDKCQMPYRLSGTENYYEQVCDCGIPMCPRCKHPRHCGQVSHELLGQPTYDWSKPCPCCGVKSERP